MIALVALSLSFPTNLNEDFIGNNYVSKFARTGVEAILEFADHGFLEADARAARDLKAAPDLKRAPAAACHASRNLPHIILLHDESSFDIATAPGIKVPPGYANHFQSFDGKARKLLVEGVGGPSWFSEYNVLTGLSVRSYGRFATSVTRIAAGRVSRGLPHSLSRCGYKTFSLYPFYGAFLGSRAFQMTTGIAYYLDMRDLGTSDFEADRFYFDQAVKIIEHERGDGPLFLYVYTVANHFPWDTRLRPELTPDWRDLGNAPDVEEYIRRQGMMAHDYSKLLQQLAQNFPAESFLIVRYGDHQPQFGARILDPSLSTEALSRRLAARDPRYLTTYYAIDAVNFTPADLSSALDTLDAPYLPLVIQEAAGVPLDLGFSEQKKILQRCDGLFYGCGSGRGGATFQSAPDRRGLRERTRLTSEVCDAGWRVAFRRDRYPHDQAAGNPQHGAIRDFRPLPSVTRPLYPHPGSHARSQFPYRAGARAHRETRRCCGVRDHALSISARLAAAAEGKRRKRRAARAN